MLRTLSLAAALVLGAATFAAPATAQGYAGGGHYGQGGYGPSYGGGYPPAYRGYDDRGYRSRYQAPGYRYRRCDRGTTATNHGYDIGDAGTILGGVLGALAGRAIDRSDNPRGC